MLGMPMLAKGGDAHENNEELKRELVDNNYLTRVLRMLKAKKRDLNQEIEAFALIVTKENTKFIQLGEEYVTGENRVVFMWQNLYIRVDFENGKNGKVITHIHIVVPPYDFVFNKRGHFGYQRYIEATMIIKIEHNGNGKLDTEDKIRFLRTNYRAVVFTTLPEDRIELNGGNNLIEEYKEFIYVVTDYAKKHLNK